MTRREAYLGALRRQEKMPLTFVANFDHWYGVNTANGTIPEEYRGLSNNEITRAVGGTLWRRVSLVRSTLDPSVTVETEDLGENLITWFRTPVGQVYTRHQQAPDSSHAWFLVEHRVKRFEDLRVLRYILEATQRHLDTTQYETVTAEVGDDGIVLTCLDPVPFIEFAKVEVGYENAYYLLADHPDEVAAVLAAARTNFLESYRLAAQGPWEVVSNGDNMDQLTCPPHFFERYAKPYYQEVREILHAGGKIAQGHWCGKLDRILPLVADCGLDVIEAVTPKPMSNVDMRVAMDLLEGKVAVQGGVPAVYMCHEGCTRNELKRFILELLEQVGHCRGFILGMGDNVPPNADFPRVKMIADLVAEFNGATVAA
ncbi:MAG TPA: uroporphyrinogen decarboxylase family protein [Armatimonadota bacterium]